MNCFPDSGKDSTFYTNNTYRERRRVSLSSKLDYFALLSPRAKQFLGQFIQGHFSLNKQKALKIYVKCLLSNRLRMSEKESVLSSVHEFLHETTAVLKLR